VASDVSSKRLMISAAVGYFLIAMLHLAAPFLGPWTYSYFGANYLARLAQSGSMIPAIAGFIIGIAFTGFGFMGVSVAGVKRSRRLDRPILWGVGVILVLRGLVVVPQIFLLFRGLSTFARGPVFSLIALVIGAVQLIGLWKTRSTGSSAELNAG
jgi:hypothetical protein